MNRPPFAFSAPDRLRLRTTISDIDRQIRCLSREGTVANHRAALGDLTTSWAALIKLLAPAPPPAQVPDQQMGWTALPGLAEASLWRWRQ